MNRNVIARFELLEVVSDDEVIIKLIANNRQHRVKVTKTDEVTITADIMTMEQLDEVVDNSQRMAVELIQRVKEGGRGS